MSTTKALAVVAVSHQRAPLGILEQVNLDSEGCAALARLLTAIDGISEAVVVSTCNRTELYLAGDAPDAIAAVTALTIHVGARPGSLDEYVRHAAGCNAALHLFRVAAGLESRVAGEREILGQLRSAIAVAREAGTVGSHLDCMFRSGIAVGRRAQQTDPDAPSLLPQLGLNAAHIDETQAGGLTVVMGAGQMAAATVRELVARGMDYVVCARRQERAAVLASRPEQVVAFDELHAVLDRADVVVCATGARTPLLTGADAELAMARRAGRPLVIVDLSLPRNVDPAAGRVPGLRLLDLEDLVSGSSVVELRRRTEIIDEEFDRFSSWLAGQHAGHMIAALHSGVYAQCREALSTSLDVGIVATTIEAAARSVAGRLLHAPTMNLKAMMAKGDEAGAAAILAAFGITGWQQPAKHDEVAPRGLDLRPVRLAGQPGHRRHEVGRVRRRTPSGSRLAS
ncbi:MAG TPA: glutamyl-tRNA reductase [Ilumatobacteraceae bacterium]|jgi:glutamyl-tRNA reductase|nr:glutamyl-tRNA reductase [Ilumatobacteraceae bacterium]